MTVCFERGAEINISVKVNKFSYPQASKLSTRGDLWQNLYKQPKASQTAHAWISPWCSEACRTHRCCCRSSRTPPVCILYGYRKICWNRMFTPANRIRNGLVLPHTYVSMETGFICRWSLSCEPARLSVPHCHHKWRISLPAMHYKWRSSGKNARKISLSISTGEVSTVQRNIRPCWSGIFCVAAWV